MIDKTSVQQLIQNKLILGNNSFDINNSMNICYVFDHGAVRGAGVSICSICKNNFSIGSVTVIHVLECYDAVITFNFPILCIGKHCRLVCIQVRDFNIIGSPNTVSGKNNQHNR